MARTLKRKGIAISTTAPPKRRKYTTRQETSGIARGKPRLPPEYRGGQWPVKGILEESRQQYLVDWADHPFTGEVYDPTWEHKGDVGDGTIEEWEAEKRQKALEVGSAEKRTGLSTEKTSHPIASSSVSEGDSSIAQFNCSISIRGEQVQLPRPKSKRSKRLIIYSSSPVDSPLEIPETQPVVALTDSDTSSVRIFTKETPHTRNPSSITVPQNSAVVATQSIEASAETVPEDSTLGDSLPPDSPVQTTLDLPVAHIHKSQACQETFSLLSSDLADNIHAAQAGSVEDPAQQRQSPPNRSRLFVSSDNQEEIQPITPLHQFEEDGQEEDWFELLPTARLPEKAPSGHPDLLICGSIRHQDSSVTAHCPHSEQKTTPQPFSTVPRFGFDQLPISSSTKSARSLGAPSSPPFHTQVSLLDYPPLKHSSFRASSPLNRHLSQSPTAPLRQRQDELLHSPYHKSSHSNSRSGFAAAAAAALRCRTPSTPLILPSIEADMPNSRRASSPRVSTPATPPSNPGNLREKLRRLRAESRQKQDSRAGSQARSESLKPSQPKDLEIRSPEPSSTAKVGRDSITAPPPSAQDEPIPSLEKPDRAADEMEMDNRDVGPDISSAAPPPPMILQSLEGSLVVPVQEYAIDDDNPEPEIPIMPLLRPNEFVIALPIDGRIKHQYIAVLNESSHEINAFLESPKSPPLMDAMIDMIRRLNDTIVHTDLGLNGPATQAVSTQEEMLWAEEASMKFAFLARLVKLLRRFGRHIVIVVREGPTLEVVKGYLKGKRVNFEVHLGADAPTELHEGDPNDSTWYHIISSKRHALQQIPLSSSLIVALDESFDSANVPDWCQSTNSVPVLLLLIVNSAEHVGRCVPQGLPPSERLAWIVKAALHLHLEVGDMPLHLDLRHDPSLEQGARLAMVKKDLGARIDYAAGKTAQALKSETFAAHFNLPMIPELDLVGLPNHPLPSEVSKELSRTTSRASTPVGQKRLRDKQSSDGVAQAKRPRLTPLRDMTHVSDSAKDTQAQIDDLKATVRMVQHELGEERRARQKAEESASYSQTRLQEISHSLGQLQHRYETRRKQVYNLEREQKRLVQERDSEAQRREELQGNHQTLKEQHQRLQDELQEARKARSNNNSNESELAGLQKHPDETASAEESARFHTKLASLQQDLDFTRTVYQDASTKAADHALTIGRLESANALLTRQASSERRQLAEMNFQEARKQDLDKIEELELGQARLRACVERVEEENKSLLLRRGKGSVGVVTRASSAQPNVAGGDHRAGGSGSGSGSGSGGGGVGGLGRAPSRRVGSLSASASGVGVDGGGAGAGSRGATLPPVPSPALDHAAAKGVTGAGAGAGAGAAEGKDSQPQRITAKSVDELWLEAHLP